ncbi:hypothetical protein VQ300_004877 [Salmonella enterica]|nr:hypothetical protein [Salmonella enterica]
MKTTLFTAGQVMACLMLLGLSTGESADASTTVEAVFNLKAMYKNVTCNQTLEASGDISSTTIDFGTFSSDSVKKTKSVVLTLKCDSDLPDTVKVGFSVANPAKVDVTNNNRLYPSDPSGNTQENLYYDWVWGNKITDAVKNTPVDSAHKGLSSIDLSGASSADVYEIVPQSNGVKSLNFPLDITRNVNDVNKLAAGDYTANVTVTISYD